MQHLWRLTLRDVQMRQRLDQARPHDRAYRTPPRDRKRPTDTR